MLNIEISINNLPHSPVCSESQCFISPQASQSTQTKFHLTAKLGIAVELLFERKALAYDSLSKLLRPLTPHSDNVNKVNETLQWLRTNEDRKKA